MYARALAASQASTTWSTRADEPRSIWIHCGSLNVLDQRVPGSPSTAAVAAKAAFSLLDAVTGRFCEISGPAAEACSRDDQGGRDHRRDEEGESSALKPS